MLVPLLPVSATVIGIGALLVLAGLAVGLLFRALPGGTALAVAGAAALLAAVAALSGSRCQTESVYFCANVVADPDRPAGRTLMLDDLRHSYVDLRDPRHLEFAYTRWMGDAIDGDAPARRAARRGLRRRRRVHAPALPRRHAAGLALARARGRPAARRPRARASSGCAPGRTCGSQVGDARVTLRDEPGGSADLVVGDAFGGRSVPWHLATREFAADVRRVLRPDGIYLLNVIDFGDLDLVRAEAATLLDVVRRRRARRPAAARPAAATSC